MEKISTTESTHPLSSEAETESDAPYSLAQSGGRFADDPFWDQMQESIRRHRREMDAEWDTAE